MSMTHSADVLEYRQPPARPSAKDALPAALLMLPGVCGAVLMAGAMVLDTKLAWAIGPRVGAIIWIVAIASTIYSFHYFRKRPKRWYVVLCLTFNTLGLIFTLVPPG